MLPGHRVAPDRHLVPRLSRTPGPGAAACPSRARCNAEPRADAVEPGQPPATIARGPLRCGRGTRRCAAAGRGNWQSTRVVRSGFGLEVLDHGFGAIVTCRFEQDFDFLLGRFKRGLAGTRERHAPLEVLERFLEREVAALETFDERFKLCHALFEVGKLLFACGHATELKSGCALQSAA